MCDCRSSVLFGPVLLHAVRTLNGFWTVPLSGSVAFYVDALSLSFPPLLGSSSLCAIPVGGVQVLITLATALRLAWWRADTSY